MSRDGFRNDYQINNHFVEGRWQEWGQLANRLADLFGDDVSMLVHELLLAHVLPGKIFNLFALQTQHFVCTPLNASLIPEIGSNLSHSSWTLSGKQTSKKNREKDP